MSSRVRALAYYIREAGRHSDGWSDDAAQEIHDCLLAMDKELSDLRAQVKEIRAFLVLD